MHNVGVCDIRSLLVYNKFGKKAYKIRNNHPTKVRKVYYGLKVVLKIKNSEEEIY